MGVCSDCCLSDVCSLSTHEVHIPLCVHKGVPGCVWRPVPFPGCVVCVAEQTTRVSVIHFPPRQAGDTGTHFPAAEARFGTQLA